MKTYRTKLQHLALAPWVRATLDYRPASLAELVERDTTRRRDGAVLKRHKPGDLRGALRHLVATGVAIRVRGGWTLTPKPQQPSFLEE